MTNFAGWASLAPDGHTMCCLCFEQIPLSELHVDDEGQRWDVCIACHAMEQAIIERRKETR